jgi:uncharacterized protein
VIRLLSAVLMLWFSGTCFAEADAERHKNGCDGGDVFSCALLGSMYQWGDGVGQDSLKAIEYYEKGCDGGGGYSCLMLGGMYEEGLGVKQSDSQALKFLGLACDLELEVGCAEFEKLKK